MTFDRNQLVERLNQIRRPLQFAARQNFRKIAVVQDLEARLLEWLQAAAALQPPPDVAANLDACRRLFTGFDKADPAAKRQIIVTALGRLDHLIAVVERHTAGQPQDISAPPLAEGEDAGGDGSNTPVPSIATLPRQGEWSPSSLLPSSNRRAASEAKRVPDSATASPSSINILTQPIQFIKGVGPNRAQMLKRIGIATIGDAFALLPRRYEDRTNLKPIRSLEVGVQATFEGTILISGSSRTGRGKRLYEIIVGDATGTIRCLWFQFQEAYMRQRYRPGQRVIVTGEIRINPYAGQRKEVHHPDLEHLDANEREPLHVGRIVPVYPATEGLHQKTLRTVLKRVVDEYAVQVPDSLPPALRESLHLMEASQALRGVHFPPADADIESLNRWSSEAHRRLVFEEFFVLELGLALRQRETTTEERRITYRGTGELARRLRAQLPYASAAPDEPPPPRRCRERQNHRRASDDAPGDRERLPSRHHGANGNSRRATLSDDTASRGSAWGEGRLTDERHQGE
jgi:hypothetical protein